MRERNLRFLIGIIILTAIAAWIDWPTNPGIHIHRDILGFRVDFDKDIIVHQGLDLQGGLQVLLVADVPEGEKVDAEAMEAAKTIVENRVNGLGVTEPLVQRQGEKRIIVELPGIKDPDQAIAILRETGLLEFIDAGDTFLPPGTPVKTDFLGGESGTPVEILTPSGEMTTTATLPAGGAVTETTPLGATEPLTQPTRVFHTILTGKYLKSATPALDKSGAPEIHFELDSEGAAIFADFTARNVGRYMAIVMDKVVISSPRIQEPIPSGNVRITGKFTLEEAKAVAIQLKYGALPVPLRVETNRTVGPTLGREAIEKSIRAGFIGLIVVLLFMLTYYRLPGFLADLALIIYALLNFAIYKFGIPGLFDGVTLTLPGITGFLLSTGMAVDANILIFERMKEEIRGGRHLGAAIDAGFDRAWTSIRDSNLSTLLTCVILFWFGSNFGASVVKGFAITLFIGVALSMFTAITVTRTFLSFVFDLAGDKLHDKHWLLGI